MSLKERFKKWLKKAVDFLQLGYDRQKVSEMYADQWIECDEYLKRIRELDEKHE